MLCPGTALPGPSEHLQVPEACTKRWPWVVAVPWLGHGQVMTPPLPSLSLTEPPSPGLCWELGRPAQGAHVRPHCGGPQGGEGLGQ